MKRDEADRAVLRAAQEIVERVEVDATRLASLRRRLRRALRDLELHGITGGEWCRIGDAGFEFEELNARQADRLVCALEDLAERLQPAPPPSIDPDQLEWDFDL